MIWSKGSSSKYWKHQKFLKGTKKEYELLFMPNDFSFIVPEDLKDFLWDKISNTPYGIYYYKWREYYSYYDHEQSGHWDVVCFKEAVKVHKRKYNDAEFTGIFRKLSTENNILRQKLYWVPGGKNEISKKHETS